MWAGSQPPHSFSLSASSRSAGPQGPRGPTGRSEGPGITQGLPPARHVPWEAGVSRSLKATEPRGPGSQGNRVHFQLREGLKGPFLVSPHFSETS